MFPDSLVELEAVFFGIFKTAQFFELIIAIIGETCVLCYFVTLRNEEEYKASSFHGPADGAHPFW